MRPIRRLLARCLLAPFLLLPLLSCGYPKPSLAAATAPLRATPGEHVTPGGRELANVRPVIMNCRRCSSQS